MAFFAGLVFLSFAAFVLPIPQHLLDGLRRGYRPELEEEASGGGPAAPVRGVVRVVQLDPRQEWSRRGLTSRRAPSPLKARPAPPPFLSLGRPGPALVQKIPLRPQSMNRLHPKAPPTADVRRRQGLQMWQRVVEKEDRTSVMLKDMKQTCAAVPFTQKVTSEGCETVTVHNKLCFGQCSSMFVPEVDMSSSSSSSSSGTSHHRRTPCSRCAPSRTRSVTVPLLCGGGGGTGGRSLRERRVMVVEECKCETGQEERATLGSPLLHL